MKPDHLGHVHLKVRDLEAQEAFYKKILGVKVTQKVKNEFVFLSLGKHHHDIALMNIGKQAPT
ncbi:MAG TPA: VOC family protein, partial [Candidatus Nanoarchaeia archaeon]|nr:VOC family protein [Candidatus Nanoarchaeia archaeon]